MWGGESDGVLKTLKTVLKWRGCVGWSPEVGSPAFWTHCSSFPRLSTHRVCACESSQRLWKHSMFKLRPGLASGFIECPAFAAPCPVCLILCSHGDKIFLWSNLTKLVLSCSGKNNSNENPAVETKPK